MTIKLGSDDTMLRLYVSVGSAPRRRRGWATWECTRARNTARSRKADGAGFLWINFRKLLDTEILAAPKFTQNWPRDKPQECSEWHASPDRIPIDPEHHFVSKSLNLETIWEHPAGAYLSSRF